MYKSIIIKIMFLSLCVFVVGCGKKSELKTDCEENNSYIIEDLLEYSVESGDIYVEMLENNIVYNHSGQSLMVADQNGQNARELLNLENEQFICGIGYDNQNILVMTEKVGQEDDSFHLTEVNLTGGQKGEVKELSVFPKNIVKDNKNRWIVLSGEGDIYVYDNSNKSGQKLEREGFVESICSDVNGHVLIVENIDNVYRIVNLKEDLQNGEEKIVLNNVGSKAELFTGHDGKQYFSEDNYLYSFDLNRKIVQPVLRWVDMGLDSSAIKKISVFKGGYIYVAMENDGQCVIKKLSPDKKSSKNQKELVLACVGLNSILQEQILKFNNESNGYKISIRDYAEEENPYQVLNMDIISGKQFDIISLEGLDVQNYIKKGLLADLSEYINEDDYVSACMEAISVDGCIYQISPYFSIQTILGKTKDVGEKMGWTCEEMIKFLEDNRETRGLLYYDESDLLGVFTWSGLEGYLEEDKNGKHFQKESLENTLEFVQNYQEYALKNESNTDIPSSDMLYQGELSLFKIGLSSGEDYRAYKTMFRSDITAKGYPTGNASGNYMYLGMPIAICSKSNQKEASWEFISYLLTDEMQYELKEYGFPVKRKVLNQLHDEWCGNGKKEDEHLTITIGGVEKKVPYLNEKDVDDLETIIESSTKLRADLPELEKIVREESQLYFRGQQDLENTSKYIEQRINTYLEERK